MFLTGSAAGFGAGAWGAASGRDPAVAGLINWSRTALRLHVRMFLRERAGRKDRRQCQQSTVFAKTLRVA